MNKRAMFALLWGGVLTGFLGLYLGTSSRRGDLGGATVTCGSPWSPNEFVRLYRGADHVCEATLGSAGLVAVILTVLGALMVITLLAVASLTPSVGTPDHP